MPEFVPHLSRRKLFTQGAKLSLMSMAVLSGINVKAMAEKGSSTTMQDIDVLNGILGTEHEGIAAYQLCIDGGLFKKETAKTASVFQSHHMKHRDVLIERISGLGGMPASAKTLVAYQSDLDTDLLKTQTQALHLIAKLELGAANAYIGMLPSTNDHELAKVAGRIAADEVMHWTTLSALLHLPVPAQALSFGV